MTKQTFKIGLNEESNNNNTKLKQWLSMDYIKALVNLGFAVFVALYMLIKMETVMNRINDELVTVHTLINERKEVDLKLLNILEKLNDRNSK